MTVSVSSSYKIIPAVFCQSQSKLSSPCGLHGSTQMFSYSKHKAKVSECRDAIRYSMESSLTYPSGLIAMEIVDLVVGGSSKYRLWCCSRNASNKVKRDRNELLVRRIRSLFSLLSLSTRHDQGPQIRHAPLRSSRARPKSSRRGLRRASARCAAPPHPSRA